MPLQDKIINDFREFQKEHQNCILKCNRSPTMILRITETGIGAAITVQCSKCKKIKDISHVEDW